MSRGQRKRLLREATRDRVGLERVLSAFIRASEGRFVTAKTAAKDFAKTYSVGELAALRSTRYD